MRTLLLALLISLPAAADTSADKKQPNGGKAKTCKVDSDCQGRQRCRDSKCEPAPPPIVHPVT